MQFLLELFYYCNVISEATYNRASQPGGGMSWWHIDLRFPDMEFVLHSTGSWRWRKVNKIWLRGRHWRYRNGWRRWWQLPLWRWRAAIQFSFWRRLSWRQLPWWFWILTFNCGEVWFSVPLRTWARNPILTNADWYAVAYIFQDIERGLLNRKGIP